jgi:hypothetical protein
MLDHPMRLRWPNGATIVQHRQQRQIGKKKAPAGTGLVGAKFAILPEYPSQGASRDRYPHSVRPVCGGSAKPCRRKPQKMAPNNQARGQAGHGAHLEGRHSKDGHPQRQPASWRAFGQALIVSRLWNRVCPAIFQRRPPRCGQRHDVLSRRRRQVADALAHTKPKRLPDPSPLRAGSPVLSHPRKKPRPGCAVRVPLCKLRPGKLGRLPALDRAGSRSTPSWRRCFTRRRCSMPAAAPRTA